MQLIEHIQKFRCPYISVSILTVIVRRSYSCVVGREQETHHPVRVVESGHIRAQQFVKISEFRARPKRELEHVDAFTGVPKMQTRGQD